MTQSRARRGWPLGLVALVIVFVVAIGAVFYGAANRPDFDVFFLDAGPIEDYEVGEPRFFPQARIYVVALDEAEGAKNLRALDAIAPIGTGCVVELDPDDPRGAERNPLGRPGVLNDSCSQAVWYLTGDALERTSRPLRTFHITQPPPENEDGRRIVEVEVIGRPNLAEEQRQR
jgi:hypothetical protein